MAQGVNFIFCSDNDYIKNTSFVKYSPFESLLPLISSKMRAVDDTGRSCDISCCQDLPIYRMNKCDEKLILCQNMQIN